MKTHRQCMNSMDAIGMTVLPVIQIEPQTFILTTQTGLPPRSTYRRKQELRDKGYTVVRIWEQEFDSQLKHQEELRNFVQELDFKDPLNPRDSLYGGRTNAIRLFCTEVDMRYVDVCSLYPYVLKYRLFPVGHPEILTDNFGDLRAYFGLIKCRVLPPRGLYHPVLPYRSVERSLFPLCRACAEQRQSLEPE